MTKTGNVCRHCAQPITWYGDNPEHVHSDCDDSTDHEPRWAEALPVSNEVFKGPKETMTVADLVALDPEGKLRIRARYGSVELKYAHSVDGTIYLDTEGWDER